MLGENSTQRLSLSNLYHNVAASTNPSQHLLVLRLIAWLQFFSSLITLSSQSTEELMNPIIALYMDGWTNRHPDLNSQSLLSLCIRMI